MRILEELWDGGLHPASRPIRRGEEYSKVVRDVSVSEEKLTAALNTEQGALFDSFLRVYDGLVSYSERESFVTGFRLGARMMLDVFADGK